tara:strand:+ start:228 stop:437 length:210 start_codon:yes stop_codon:yes gene_type:complete
MQIQVGKVSHIDRDCSDPNKDWLWLTIASGTKSEVIDQFLNFLNDRSSDEGFSLDDWWFRTKEDVEVSK